MSRATTITIIILIVLVVAALGYIGYDQYSKIKQRQLSGYATLGYQQAIVDVARLAATCQPVPLNIGNQTINMIAVECLQQQQQAPPAQ